MAINVNFAVNNGNLCGKLFIIKCKIGVFLPI